MENLNVFGYWTGNSLPEVTKLHFNSFRYHHPNTNYFLFIDTDYVDEATHDFLVNPRLDIKVVRFSLNELIKKYLQYDVLKMEQSTLTEMFRKLARRTHKVIAPRFPIFGSRYSPKIGLSYKHSSTLFHGFHNFAYRSDVARVLLAVEHFSGGATLYVDLDFCFHRNLEPLLNGAMSTYWWEEGFFCNSAFLFTEDSVTRHAILNRAIEIDTFWPWELYESSFLDTLGAHIFPKRNFDPLWSSEYVINDSKDFFIASLNTRQIILDYSDPNLYASHWHNNWSTQPTSGSPYFHFFEKYK